MDESQQITCPEWYQAILKPISDEAPCGNSLEYDADFIMLQSRIQPKLGAEYGDFVEVVESINWSEVERDCIKLLTKAIDLRLIIILIRCRMRQIGVAALEEGIKCLLWAGAEWSEVIHPQLYDEGEYEPLLRINAYNEIESIDTFLADVRQLPLPKTAGMQLTVKEFEKANAWPREENALPQMALDGIKSEWAAALPAAIQSLQSAFKYLQLLKQQLDTLSEYNEVDFPRLLKLLRCFVLSDNSSGFKPEQATAVGIQVPTDSPEVQCDDVIPASLADTPKVHTVASVEINSRTDVLRQLHRIKSWLIESEPSSPAITLIHLTEKTIGKNFSELLQLLPAELITKLETLQGD